MQDATTDPLISITSFAALIPLCTFVSWNSREFAYTLRSALACGLALAFVVDQLLDKSLTHTVYAVMFLGNEKLKIDNETYYCISIFVVGSAASLFFQYRVLQRMSEGEKGKYLTLSERHSSEFLVVQPAKQQTFSYPDHLEFNYFDPDDLPRHLQTHADTVFSTVQMLASELGFQVDSSRNQAEHLLMMISNECKSGENIVTETPARLHRKLFSNYRLWCERMGVVPAFAPRSPNKTHMAFIEDLLIFLLIWGEAANIRHLPEALCFLYHKTKGVLQINRSTGRHAKEHWYPGYYLDHVITPIYDVLARALKKKGDNSERKSYDDFNEFFWSPVCLKYDILPHDEPIEGLFAEVSSSSNMIAQALSSSRKSYIEKRSYFHAILCFHRVLEWHTILFTLCLCVGFSQLLVWTTAYTVQSASFIFIEMNAFGILWMCLELWALFPGSAINNTTICGYCIRLSLSYILLVQQCLCFSRSFDNTSNGLKGELSVSNESDSEFWWWQFIWLSLLALSLSILESIVCTWIPSVTSRLLTSSDGILQAVLGICYPLSNMYVGKKVHVDQWNVLGYAFFWSTLIAWKIYFGYHMITKPISVPTLELYDDYMNFMDVPFAKTFILMVIWWLPHFLVFLIDLAIWFSVWSSLVGAYKAIMQRMGAVRGTENLREHFMKAPHAFCQRIMPPSSSVGFRNARGPPSQGTLMSSKQLNDRFFFKKERNLHVS